MAEPNTIDRPRDPLTTEESEARYFSIGQAAKILGVSTRTLERHRVSGKLVPDSRTPGGHARYSAAQLQAVKETTLTAAEKARQAPSGLPADDYRYVQRILARRRVRNFGKALKGG